MPVLLSERVANLKPSASIAARKKVTELQASGRRIIDFTIGEPDLDTPPHIIEAGLKAMRGGETHYTVTAGTPALRAAICNKLQTENGVDYTPAHIVVGCGAKQLIFEAFAATLNPGDEVIVPAPYWVSYPDMVGMNSGKAIIVSCTEDIDFKLTPTALEKAITPRTRWLVLNSPNNPTGAVYSVADLRALAEVLVRHPHVWVLTDDIYEHLVYDGVRHANPVNVTPELASRTLIVNGVSKAYAMTGWRIGYAAGPKDLIDAIVKVLGQSTTCPSSISQAAAIAALAGDQTCVREATNIYRERRDRIIELLHGVPGLGVTKPAGAFYLYPSVAGLIGKKTPEGAILNTDLDVSLYLLDRASVAVLDGAAYGLSPYLRLSFATSLAVIEEGCAAIQSACELLFE